MFNIGDYPPIEFQVGRCHSFVEVMSEFIEGGEMKKNYGYLTKTEAEGLFCNSFENRCYEAIRKRLEEYDIEVCVCLYKLFGSNYILLIPNEHYYQSDICQALDIPSDIVGFAPTGKGILIQKEKFIDLRLNEYGEVDFPSNWDIRKVDNREDIEKRLKEYNIFAKVRKITRFGEDCELWAICVNHNDSEYTLLEISRALNISTNDVESVVPHTYYLIKKGE